MPKALGTEPAATVAKLRIDKWLWAARFYRTRSLAAAAVEAGQVRVNGERVKPSRAVHAGERVTVRKAGFAWDVEVHRRRRAPRLGDRGGEALFRVRDEPRRHARRRLRKRRAAAASDPRFDGRPTKRERRKLEDFLNEP